MEKREIKRRSKRNLGKLSYTTAKIFEENKKLLHFLDSAYILRKIAGDCSELIEDELIYNNKIFYMPFGLGSIMICKRKGNRKIDGAFFNNTGKIKRHLNKHTDGYAAYHTWHKKTNSTYKVRGLLFWAMKTYRGNARLLSREFGSGEIDYPEKKFVLYKRD